MSESKLTEYEVEIGGIPHTLLLSAEDAERYGEGAKKKTGEKAVSTPQNKSTTPANK